VLLPLTALVPTVVPPVVQVVGADAKGPKTVKVTVPVGLEPPERVAEIVPAVMAVPTVPVEGPDAPREVVSLPTAVSDIPLPQVDTEVLLLESPL
jgi:hypothetical protein